MTLGKASSSQGISSHDIKQTSALSGPAANDGALISACSVRQAAGIDLDEEILGSAAGELSEVTWVARPVEEVESAPMENPDYVVLSMVLDEVYDAQPVLEQVHDWCEPETRVVVVTYSRLWRPLLRVAEFLRLKVRKPFEKSSRST